MEGCALTRFIISGKVCIQIIQNQNAKRFPKLLTPHFSLLTQIIILGVYENMSLIVMKFGGTSVKDAVP